MKHMVSIIIPAYNMSNYIEACIRSVLKQTYTDCEIIIVNDGSVDDTAAICAEFANTCRNVVLFTQENQGVSAARNTGMALSKGDYILFLDADDTMPPNAVEDLLEAAEKHGSDMTIGKIFPDEQIPMDTFSGEEFLIKCLEDNPIAYYSVRILYKRDFLQGISFEKGFVCGEDSYFVFECARKKPKVATIDRCVYSYTVNLNSATRSAFSRKRYDSVCQLLDKKESIISKEFPHLLELFYHLKVKIQMMLLTNLAGAKGNGFKNEEQETLRRFNEHRSYFRADLPYANTAQYNMLVKYGYGAYKVYIKFRQLVKYILKR